MTYIVLDMEWSQPVTKERSVRRGDLILPVEIIQIGAAAVKDGKILPTAFDEYIKPVYYTKLRPKIRRLTGITPEMLQGADDFERVLMRFRQWIRSMNDETMIVIWGNEDVQVLKSQCEFFGCDCGWIPEWFNLQPLLTRKYHIDRPQMTLSGAVELIGADDSELRYHSAANDAYYTALVLSKMDKIPERLEWQRKVEHAHRNPISSLSVTYYGTRTYRNKSDALKSGAVNSWSCPVCGRQYGLRGASVKLSDNEYLSVRACPTHRIAAKLKLEQNSDGRYYAQRAVGLCDDETERLYDALAEQQGVGANIPKKRGKSRK
ncbi:MAG: exonuclease domain-containing protein [Eubacterium sp.]|nr:exonuclease domain-containing protein [Eubacterium sp.]